MKYLISLLAFVFSITIGFSQNAFDVVNSHGTPEAGTMSSSLANPWVGSKLSYNLDEDRPLSESFLLSAKVLYVPVAGERYAIPVVGSVGLGDDDIFNPESGINLGIYPYYKLTANGNFALIAHGGVGYKIIEAGVAEGEDAPQQLRVVGGLEAVFMPDNGSSPTTLSVTPMYLFNTNAVGNTGGIEITGVLPIAKGVGFLAEGLLPFNSGEFNSGLRFGIIVNGAL